MKIFMIWADKVALGVTASIAAAGFFVWLLAIIALKTAFDGSFDRYMLFWIAEAELAVALPLWLGLRAVDWFLGGPARRQAQRDSVPEHPAAPNADVL